MAGYSVTYSVVDNATKQIDAINKRITQMRAPMDRMSRSISRFVDVSGLRKVAEGFGWIGRAAATAFRAMIAIVPVLGAITSAATIAGIAKLVSSFSAWGRQLTINADQIGISTQQLQQFEDATRLAGGNTDDMTESLKGLHDATVRAFEGQDPQALAYFNQLGISLRDANGHMRTTADLMPEVMQKLQDIKDPTDRARIATALLGGAGMKLVETFRVSRQSLGEWMTDASKFTELTQQQLQGMIAFEQAQGRLGVAFDHLGQQVSAVLAKNFTPLFNHLSEFVTTHQPQIIAAVDQLSARFSKWLDNPDMWKAIGDGLTKTIDGLKWMVDNLDTVLHYAEVIAAVFAVKWALGIAASIAQVTLALGAVSGGVSAGTGLLGALGAVAALAAGLAAAYGAKQALDAGSEKVERGIFGDKRVDERQRMQEEGGKQFWQQIPSWLGGTGGATGGLGTLWNRAMRGPESIQPGYKPQSLNLPQDTIQRGAAITARLATDLNLTPQQAAGITGNLQAESGLQAVQERSPIGGGRGGIGWAQWTGPRRDEFEAYAKANNLDPKSDEANYGFLLKELHGAGSAKMLEQLRALSGPDAARKSAAIVEREYERPAVSNAGTRGNYADQIASALPLPPRPPAQVPPVASAPPAAMPPAAPPINGSVDVSITHRNPPPNAAVTATGSGSVNVAPPRVEHAALADI
jgi:Phage tail lysozyme